MYLCGGMKRFAYINILIFTLLYSVKIFAQSPLVFDSTEHSFGNIREEAGRVKHKFRFRNSGNEPIVILSVGTTCGCTVAHYERKPILPDSTGYIEVSFDPTNRAGSFDKDVTVYDSSGEKPQRLTIFGSVEERERSIEELYPIFIGNGLRLEDNFHAFAYVEQGKPAQTALKIINTSNKTVRLRAFEQRPCGVMRIGYPERLAPHQQSEITITYDAPIDSLRYGTIDGMVDFEVNGHHSEAFISVTGIIIDNRDKIDPNCAPKVEVMKNIVKFGPVKRHEAERVGYLTIENSGSAPLEIRAVEVLHSTVTLSLSAGDTIAAGESREVELRLRPLRVEYGPLVERIRIVTNDPAHPMRTLRVTAIIEE